MKESLSEQSLKTRFLEYKKAGDIKSAEKTLAKVVGIQVDESVSKAKFKFETRLNQDTVDFIGSLATLDSLQPKSVVREAEAVSRAYQTYFNRTGEEIDRICYPKRKGE